MGLADLGGVLKIFGGSEPSEEEKAELAKEVMLMLLARATAADTNIKQVEIDKVAQVLKAQTGEAFSDADIRVAANSRIYEKAPLDRYVETSARKLAPAARLQIAEALKAVIHSDDRVSDYEISFFNNIVGALDLTPGQMMGIE